MNMETSRRKNEAKKRPDLVGPQNAVHTTTPSLSHERYIRGPARGSLGLSQTATTARRAIYGPVQISLPDARS